jgi:hypothetical protein
MGISIYFWSFNCLAASLCGLHLCSLFELLTSRLNGFFKDLHSTVAIPAPPASQSTKAKECRMNNACNTARDDPTPRGGSFCQTSRVGNQVLASSLILFSPREAFGSSTSNIHRSTFHDHAISWFLTLFFRLSFVLLACNYRVLHSLSVLSVIIVAAFFC